MEVKQHEDRIFLASRMPRQVARPVLRALGRNGLQR